MFLATPTEVARLEAINQRLRELTKQLEDKISILYYVVRNVVIIKYAPIAQ